MKEKILQLRDQGFSYQEIKNKLGCSLGTISYHCGEGQKKKSSERQKKNREKLSPLQIKLNQFLYVKTREPIKYDSKENKQLIYRKILRFHGDEQMSFTVQDIIDKFGTNPKCYLTGVEINLNEKRSYHFDHIIPSSKNGPNTLDNLGICTRNANQAKNDMTPDEFINLCKQVLEHNGYELKKKILPQTIQSATSVRIQT